MSTRYISIASPTDNNSLVYTTSLEINDGRDSVIESTVNPSSYRNGHEPTIDAITDFLKGVFGLKKRRRKYCEEELPPKEFKHIVKIGESGFIVMFHKTNIRYFLNGMTSSKDNLLRALARTLYKSCFTNDGLELDKYLYKNIMLPENVSYALENRAPFHWYQDGEKVECRFRVEMIGDTECAIEISDGIWCPMKTKDLNIYMNYYWKNNKRGNWKHLSPSRLWEKLMGTFPSSGQKKLMLAFLQQNRTQDLVEERAKELMEALASSNPKRIKIIKNTRMSNSGVEITNTFMFVRGKVAD